MILPIRIYKIRRILLEQWSLFVSIGIFIFLLILLIFFVEDLNTKKKEVNDMSGEIEVLRNRYDTLKYNKSLTDKNIKELNLLLANLVPENEDYFSIIYALDEISIASGFVIKNYTIDVANSDKERLTLTAEGKGDANAFLLFLQEYQFAGGRLVTSDKIQYGGENSSNTRVVLNFYSKKFVTDEQIQVTQFSKDEIAKLEMIRKKIKFQLTSTSNNQAETDYEVKKDPFSGE